MSVATQENGREISDMFLYGNILFILFREGSVRGIDLEQYMDIPEGLGILFTQENLYSSGVPVFCMLWDGNGKLLREEVSSKQDGIYVRYGSRVHKALNTMCQNSILAEYRGLCW